MLHLLIFLYILAALFVARCKKAVDKALMHDDKLILHAKKYHTAQASERKEREKEKRI